MTTRRTLLRRLAASGVAAGCLAALGLLWQLRPQLPGAPVDAAFAGELLRLLLWGTVALLVLVLLARALRAGGRSAAAAPVPRPRAKRRPVRALLDATPPRPAATPQVDRYEPEWRRPRLTLPGGDGEGAVAVAAPAAVAEPEADVAAGGEARASVLLLGPLEIPSTTGRRRALGPPHELIAYLALHPEGASRDELLEALWPEESPDRSEQRFWQASREARKLLYGAVVREAGRYRLDRDRVDVDVDRLERLLCAAAGTRDEEAERDVVEEALALFRGEPLEGCDYRWADGDLRRLTARRLELLERAGRARLASGDARGALDAAEQGIAADELNERFWQLAFEAEAAIGAREAISRRYDELAARLDERLGLKPSGETRTLYLRLLGPRS